MKVVNIKIRDLIEYQNNAKIHDEKQIKQIVKSIKEFGFNDPIAIDENNVIIEGHGRLYALQKLEYEEVPCIRLNHLNEQQKKAYILAHNKLTMNTGFDLDLLEEELIAIEDFDMTEFGFDEIDIESNYDSDKDSEFLESEEESEKKEVNIKYGDVFQLGNHKLLCMDSTKTSEILDLLGGEKADLFLTDPPYNVNYEGATEEKLKILNDNMSDSDFIKLLHDSFYTANKIMKEGASFYIWHADSESINFRSACENNLGKIRECLIWVKNHFSIGRMDYHYKHEPCLYGWKEGAAHNWYSDRKQTTILEFDKPIKNPEHPTMKPVDLLEYQIKNNTKKGDTVLDLFGGSGTTLIACENLERKAIVCELDPQYVDVIIRCWENLT